MKRFSAIAALLLMLITLTSRAARTNKVMTSWQGGNLIDLIVSWRSPDQAFDDGATLLSPTATTPPPNLSGIFLLWAIWGAVVDWRYVRRGGMKPTRNDKIGVSAAIGVSIAVFMFLAVGLGASAESLGSMTALFVTLIFSLWEFARWRIRRKNPLPRAVPPTTA